MPRTKAKVDEPRAKAPRAPKEPKADKPRKKLEVPPDPPPGEGDGDRILKTRH